MCNRECLAKKMNATISHFYKSQQIIFVYYQVNSLEATVIMSYLSGREKRMLENVITKPNIRQRKSYWIASKNKH